MENIKEHINELIKDDYLNHDLSPKKCYNCDSNNFKENIISKTETYIEEYKVICKNCQTEVGHWAYGHWII